MLGVRAGPTSGRRGGGGGIYRSLQQERGALSGAGTGDMVPGGAQSGSNLCPGGEWRLTRSDGDKY